MVTISTLLAPAAAQSTTGAGIQEDWSFEHCDTGRVVRGDQIGGCEKESIIINLYPADGRQVTVVLGTRGPALPIGARWVSAMDNKTIWCIKYNSDRWFAWSPDECTS
jgi:hypothetical protein